MTRRNPFASGPDTNPLMIADAVQLVPVPSEPIETHEQRKPRRSYLAPSGGGGGLDLSELFRGLKGKRSAPHEKAPEDDDDDAGQVAAVPAVPSSGPPRYGRR